MSNKQDVRITARTRPEVITQYAGWEHLVTNAKHSKNGHGYASFLPADKVPEHLRSIKGQVRTRDGSKGKKGEVYSAATIHDLVKWSMTLRGGKQLGMDFLFDMEDEPIFQEDDAHAPCQSGYCE